MKHARSFAFYLTVRTLCQISGLPGTQSIGEFIECM